MGYRTVVVNAHSKLSYYNNHLVFKDAKRTEMIHLSEIDVLILETMNITVTTMLVKRLLDANIVVLFCDDKRLPYGMLSNLYGRYDNSKQIKRQIEWPSTLKDQAAFDIIRQKIANQCHLLEKLDRVDKADRLYLLSKDLQIGDPSNVEAHAARIYFNSLFGNQFTRSDPTAINAGLNYGYSLLLALFAREIAANGCLTQLGMMHTNQFNNFNLASDIMEPFRIIIDDIVYRHKETPFKRLKFKLLEIFENTYVYNDQQMFLTNIVSDYTRKVIHYLDGDKNDLPCFEI